MRVVVTTEQLRRSVPGGIATYARGLLQGLAGLDVSVAAWGGMIGPRADTALWDRGLAPGLPKADLVHATSLAVPPSRRPTSVFIHDMAWREVPDAFPVRGRRWHEDALGRARVRAQLFLTPSRRSADALLADGFPAAAVEVVPEGCDHLPLHARLGDGSYFLAVSTMEPRKNLTRLLAAYAQAQPRLRHPWPLKVVGPTGWGEAIRPAAGVEFVGRVSDPRLADLFAGARLLAYVPLVEGFGLPPVEAMRAGVPVLCSSTVPSATSGAHVVDATDVDAISEGLVRVAEDDELREALRAAGAARAAALTWRATAEAHVALWERLLRGGA